MSSSISGQNERWAQLGAYQPPPISQSGQNGGWGSTNWTTASGGTNASPSSAGGASGTQSNDMSFALMAFGNASSNGSATSSQSAGKSGGTSDASSGLAIQDGSSLGSQLLAEMQSMMSALTGTAGSSTDTTNASASTGTTTATGLSGSLLQDLQTVASAFSSTASGSGSTQSGNVGGPPPGSPPWRNDISNTGTNAGNGSTGNWHPGYSDSFQNQYALAAYSASAMPSLDSSATSSLGAINA